MWTTVAVVAVHRGSDNTQFKGPFPDCSCIQRVS